MTELSLSSVYDPAQVENKWYQIWEEKNYFSGDGNASGEPFCIVMPPPNVTGQLHMGHALDTTMQDILTRFRRMQGRRALWLPGTDHAGIATQARVEEHLAQEGISKYDLGREEFLKHVWQWKEQYHGRITKQLRMLGASCDWRRERFTLDEGCSQAVREVFVRLYNEGLIYRGKYIINWCPKCQTTISDIEVEHEEQAGHLWYFKYPVEDGGYVTVATTRPETILGDTAVAVNPADERYRDMVGKMVRLPIVDRLIPIIADEYVDASYGTGAVKITPAHDPNDFAIGLRHKLPQIEVIDKSAKMTEAAGIFAGLDRYECRKQIIAKFQELGLYIKTEDLNHAVGTCYRCGSTVEPLISQQWFVKMQPLAEPAIEVVKSGKLRFVPERFSKVYLGWMENIRDWCISRQLWWGHRIPVWYCSCGEEICSLKAPKVCPKCGGTELSQDPDVLDTWFSSALWPFSTLGWPADTAADLKAFYPTSVLVTGRDIIFFWVARMIFSGLHFMNDRPFDEVFIHGLVLDAQGRKMSKSLGNGIDPIEIIDKYGADPLRFMLITGNTPGNDLRFQQERLEAARNFANKVWNASRFVLMNLEDYQPGAQDPAYTLADHWIIERLRLTAAGVTANLEKYELGEAARMLYDFIWDDFCDWYIELAKPRLYGQDPVDKYTAQTVLSDVLRQALQLLHPFMPFLTEELWQALPHDGETIMYSRWTDGSKMPEFKDEAATMNTVMDVVRAVRNLRAEMNVPPGKKADLIIAAVAEDTSCLKDGVSYLQTLGRVANITWQEPSAEQPKQAAAAHVKGMDLYLPLRGLIDLDKEIARLQKEAAQIAGELARLSGKLGNESFLAKAPAEVVAKERSKEAEYKAKQDAIAQRLVVLQQ